MPVDEFVKLGPAGFGEGVDDLGGNARLLLTSDHFQFRSLFA
jgi:hypothetical protein